MKYIKMLFVMVTIVLLMPLSALGFNITDCDKVIDKVYYKICYDYNYKGAKYVWYTLYGDKVNANNLVGSRSFRLERSIPKQYRSHTYDYAAISQDNDLGHLAPDAAFDYNKDAMYSVYTLANIIPQHKNVNRWLWSKAEAYARKVAIIYGSINVMNGVVYGNNPKRVGRSGIAYPVSYWKMIYLDGYYKRCFSYINDNSIKVRGDKLDDHEVDCRKLDILITQ